MIIIYLYNGSLERIVKQIILISMWFWERDLKIKSLPLEIHLFELNFTIYLWSVTVLVSWPKLFSPSRNETRLVSVPTWVECPLHCWISSIVSNREAPSFRNSNHFNRGDSSKLRRSILENYCDRLTRNRFNFSNLWINIILSRNVFIFH